MTYNEGSFFSQYKQELIFQEVNSNKRTLNGFVWFLGAEGVIWLLSAINFFDVNKAMVNIAFCVSFLLFLPAFVLVYHKDLSKKWIKYFLLILICIICAVIISTLSFHATLLFVFPLIFAIQYRERKILWFTYIINMITITCGFLIAFYYGLCDLNLLFASQHTRNFYLESIYSADAFLLPMNEDPVFVILAYAVIPTAIILFILAILLQYVVISNTRDALRIAKLTYYKDTDRYTNVFNKNKFEEMTRKHYPQLDQLAVVFWDLNNLKEINDRYGHATGDRVIEKLASAIHREAGNTRHVYRIGGDEFVMIIENPSPQAAEHAVHSVSEQLKIINRTEPVTIICAAGFAYGKGRDIDEVVKAADAAMYRNKHFIKKNQNNA